MPCTLACGRSNLPSRLAFTGYTLAEVRGLALGREILGQLDVLIAGRYVADRRLADGLLGSDNQHSHLLTPRYGPADFGDVPNREVILHRDGTMTVSGINPWPPDPACPPSSEEERRT